MFKNYIRIAYRNLLRNKVPSLINIAGLSAGMAIAMLIGLWIVDEWSVDKNFENYNHIATVWQNTHDNGAIHTGTNVPFALGAELRTNYGSDFRYVAMSSFYQTHVLSVGDKRLSPVGRYIEPDITRILSLKMDKGTRDGLKNPNSILLSTSLAKACFGEADPMNKILKMDNGAVLTVTGVYEDMPYNSSFAELAFILPWQDYVRGARLDQNDQPWRGNGFQVFVQTTGHNSMEKISEKIKDLKQAHADANDRSHPQLFLHPMSHWHLYSEFKNGVNAGGRIQYIWLFGISGAFVLLLACINFMNLSTARSERRAKEVGIRKAIGSRRGQLIYQFFSESVLMTALALFVALSWVQLLLPFFNQVADKKMSILWGSPLFWAGCIGFSLITGLIAGSYPALYLSSFQPVKVLKGTFRVGPWAAVPRKVLVVFQFSVSIILIIGTVVVFRQIQFAQDRPIGYDRQGLIMVPMYMQDIHAHYATVRDELKKTGAALEMAESWSPVTAVWNTSGGFNWQGKDPDLALDFPLDWVSYDYGRTVGWQFAAGRDFSRSFGTDSLSFVINETAARFMGLKDPVGKAIYWDGQTYTIIGVIKDMLSESPYDPVRPSVFHLSTNPGTRMLVKINPAVGTSAALEKIGSIFKKYSPQQPFNYEFVDQEYAKKFGDEQRIGKIAGVFAVLAIFISCLGLWGMASFMAEQRTKEIGVRKVLGATVFNLWTLLSTDFVRLVTLSLLIAFPLSWYFMQGWLEHYSYHSTIAWWIFVAAGLGAMLITLLTVSFQAIRAALVNPAKSLKTE